MIDFKEKANLIWAVADLLRGDYKQADYGKVILPMTVLRRLDCVLEPTKQKVLNFLPKVEKMSQTAIDATLNKIAGFNFHNRSQFNFKKLVADPNNIARQLMRPLEPEPPKKRIGFLVEEPHVPYKSQVTMRKKIKDIPEHERPREKLLKKGPRALKDWELLAVLLGKGTAKQDVLALAQKLVPVIDEKGLGVSVEDLAAFDGMGEAKAALVLAAMEFVRRRVKPEGIRIEAPTDLLPHVRHYADRKQEHFLCASVNGANEVINIRVVSIGLIDRSPVHPREVFADPLTDRASAIILAHNHPIGPLTPSDSDIEATKRLKAAGEVMGIAVLDHLIFNRSGYFSFLENGLQF